jgi:hypothetical protein
MPKKKKPVEAPLRGERPAMDTAESDIHDEHIRRLREKEKS